MWPGSQYEYHGKICSHTDYFNRNANVFERVNKTMELFVKKKKPANIAMFYFNQPDDADHKIGMDTKQVSELLF